ncbi:MAG: DEAD/DEAH box helicase, partial [Actinobacteria bacterium]|nr:DEAD/DEAH box helicase [Actinomycetota bacterium]
MTTTVRLRRWQRRALERLDEADSRDFLAVATPGAGKTTFALVALRRRMVDHPGRRVVVVAPTAHLKTQWAAAARSMGLVLEDAWRPTDGSLPGDIHGIVTTYQQVATSTNALARLSERGLVVLDEIHHAGDDRAWGQAVREAFTDAAWRLALSGTPFRSDSHAIPFVRYGLDEALPDFEYGYGDALADANVVRQVEFPALDGEMEWIDNEGVDRVASFADPLAPALAAQRLRTALSVDGRWLPAVIAAAHERLGTIRTSQPDAGGLVIATDQDHAKAIAASMQRTHGIAPAIATSDDARASAKIARFAASEEPWLVAVRMVSEGVDIPRLTVGVFATTTTTELFFRQAVGRFVRARRGETATVAALFVPPDRRLQSHAAEITRVRRHHLVTTAHRRVVEGELDDIAEDRTEQMSLFAPVSATPVGGVA